MKSQLCHNSRGVHRADDVTTPNFKTQVNSVSICGPQVDTLIYYSKLECLPCLVVRIFYRRRTQLNFFRDAHLRRFLDLVSLLFLRQPLKKVSPTLRLFKIKLVPVASGRVRLPKIESKSNFSIHCLWEWDCIKKQKFFHLPMFQDLPFCYGDCRNFSYFFKIFTWFFALWKIFLIYIFNIIFYNTNFRKY